MISVFKFIYFLSLFYLIQMYIFMTNTLVFTIPLHNIKSLKNTYIITLIEYE